MNKTSKNSDGDKGSIQLTDKDLAGASGGQRRVHMPTTTIIIFTEPMVITAKAPK
jgi:hypothetical protein